MCKEYEKKGKRNSIGGVKKTAKLADRTLKKYANISKRSFNKAVRMAS